MHDRHNLTIILILLFIGSPFPPAFYNRLSLKKALNFPKYSLHACDCYRYYCSSDIQVPGFSYKCKIGDMIFDAKRNNETSITCQITDNEVYIQLLVTTVRQQQ